MSDERVRNRATAPGLPTKADKQNPRRKAYPKTFQSPRTGEEEAGSDSAGTTSLAIPNPYRENPVLTRKTQEHIAEWLALKNAEPHISMAEAARRLQMSRRNLYNVISIGVKNKLLVFSDPLEKVEHEIIPKALTNLSKLLDDNDKVATIETVKNTIFKEYLESRGISEVRQTLLAIKIESPQHDGDAPKIAVGQVFGKSKNSE